MKRKIYQAPICEVVTLRSVSCILGESQPGTNDSKEHRFDIDQPFESSWEHLPSEVENESTTTQ